MSTTLEYNSVAITMIYQRRGGGARRSDLFVEQVEKRPLLAGGEGAAASVQVPHRVVLRVHVLVGRGVALRIEQSEAKLQLAGHVLYRGRVFARLRRFLQLQAQPPPKPLVLRTQSSHRFVETSCCCSFGLRPFRSCLVGFRGYRFVKTTFGPNILVGRRPDGCCCSSLSRTHERLPRSSLVVGRLLRARFVSRLRLRSRLLGARLRTRPRAPLRRVWGFLCQPVQAAPQQFVSGAPRFAPEAPLPPVVRLLEKRDFIRVVLFIVLVVHEDLLRFLLPPEKSTSLPSPQLPHHPQTAGPRRRGQPAPVVRLLAGGQPQLDRGLR
mmetsp:Transcript_3892/g.9471  ORF Transcript_3892/g.9471 Transcript_3892/m.9471 type:complete len:324 (-) Transcript_3892:948-1919(-)